MRRTPFRVPIWPIPCCRHIGGRWLGAIGVIAALATFGFAQAPVIASRPLSQSALVGQPASFTLSASGAQPLSYQWKRNGQIVTGATNATLSVGSVAFADQGWYQVIVANSQGSATSTFRLNVGSAVSTVVAWGDSNEYGQQDVPGALSHVVALAAKRHSLAVRADGSVIGWGDNSFGQRTLPPGLTGVVGIAAGNNHTVAVKSDGTVVAWGATSGGATQLPAGLAGVVAVSAGAEHSMALKADGTVVAWGYYNGVGAAATPSGLANVVAIASGADHSLALKSDGTVVAWGYDYLDRATVPAGLSNVIVIAGGGAHSVALRADGSVAQWGYSPVEPPSGLTGVAELAAGGGFTLARRADQSLAIWGNFGYGAATLPSHVTTASTIAGGWGYALAVIPVIAPSITRQPTAATTSVGNYISLSVEASGTGPLTYQWRKDGQVLTDSGVVSGTTSPTLVIATAQVANAGNYSVVVSNTAGSVESNVATLTVSTPPTVSTNARTKMAHVGQPVSLSVEASGTGALTYQWKHNGRILAGATTAALTISSSSLADRGWYHVAISHPSGTATSVAYLNVAPVNGTVAAWGRNDDGQTTVPIGLSQMSAVAAGGSHTLALKGDGTVVAWGKNSSGQCNVPAGLNRVVAIAGGAEHSLALKDDGTVVAWGANHGGQTSIPTGLNNIVAISAPGSYSLALRSDGKVISWGSSFASVPPDLVDVVAIAGGAANLAVRSDGAVAAWGWNDYGQANVPDGLTGVIAVAAHDFQSMALKSDGTVAAWGRSTFGVTTVPAGLADVVGVAAGYYFNLALKSDGLLTGWGWNSQGQLSVPAEVANVIAVAAGSEHAVALIGALPPSVIAHPESDSVAPGELVDFVVTASGIGPLSYRWKKNGVALSDGASVIGAATAKLTISNLQPSDAGNYSVEVSNAGGTVNSNIAVLVVAQPPNITSRPLSRIVTVGTSTTLAIAASDSSALSYEWRRNGQVLGGASTASLTLPAVTVADRGFYEVIVTNANGGVARSIAVVDVTALAFTRTTVVGWGAISPPPDIVDIVAVAQHGHGLALKFDGTVIGWGNNYNGEASVPAGLSDVVAISAGPSYSLALQADGTVVGWGLVPAIPTRLKQIVGVAAGSFRLALKSNRTVVQWGANAPDLPTGLSDIVAVAAGEGHGLARKSDGSVVGWGFDVYGQATVPATLTNAATVAAGGVHSVAIKPDGTFVGWGNNAYQQATAPGNLGVITAVAAGSHHTVAIKQGGAVVAWGDNTSGQSSVPAGLTNAIAISAGGYSSMAIIPAVLPVITSPPAGASVIAGSDVGLFVSAAGTAPLRYQWRRNGTPIFGATAPSLGLTNVQESDAGSYTVDVSNMAGTVTSVGAMLSVTGSSTPPVLRASPSSLAIVPGESATLAVSAAGSGVLSYQWYLGNTGDVGQPIPGATGATLSLTSPSASLRVWTRVTNSLGVIDTPAATVLIWETIDPDMRDSGGTHDLVMASYTNDRFLVATWFRNAVSPDGATWTKGETGGWDGNTVAYGHGVYVTGRTYYNNDIHTSTNGVAWTRRPEAALPNVGKVVHNGKTFIALAGQKTLSTSIDGVSWTERLSVPDYLGDLCHGNGLVVAVGSAGKVVASSDGIAWSDRSIATSSWLSAVAFANGRYMAKSNGGEVWTSPDAITWTKKGTTQLPDAIAGGGGVFVGAGGPGAIFMSNDGESWQTFANFFPPYGTVRIAYGGGRFIITTKDGKLLRSLPLGSAITTQNVPTVPGVISGNSTTLSVTTTGSGLQYQWYRGWSGDMSQPVAGATNGSYTTPPLAQATPYWARVWNHTESVASATFNVVIATAPTIVTQPKYVDILAGSTASLFVGATGTPEPSYQWYSGGTGDMSQPIPGATGTTYRTPPLSAPGSYWVRASTSAAGVNSDAAVVTPWTLISGQVRATSLAYFAGRYFAAAGSVLSSADGESWTTSFRVTGYGGEVPMKALAQGNGMLMAVGDAAIGTTSDGTNWTRYDAPTTTSNNGVLAFGAGVFVSSYGLGAPRWSADGATWTTGMLSDGGIDTIRSIAFGNGKFVAVGDAGGGSSGSSAWVIYTSMDGKAWTRQSGPSSGPISSLVHVAVAGTEYIAVGDQRTILASSDGVAWTRRPVSSTSAQFTSVGHGAGVYMVGTSGAEYLRSTDGVNWTSHPAPAYFSGNRIEFLNSRFIAAGTSGWVYSSMDGIAWTQLSGWPFVGTSSSPRGLAIGNGRYLLLSGDNAPSGEARLFLSPDGKRWLATNSPGQVHSRLVFAQGAFYCGGSNGRIYRTVDGISWETILAGPGDTGIYTLIHDGRQFVAIGGYRETGNTILISADGRAWTQRKGPTLFSVPPLASSGSVHVTASNANIYVSGNLQNWAGATVPSGTYNVQQIVYGNGRFLAYDWPGTLLMSSNGVAWTQVTVPTGFHLNSPSIAFANGRFWVLTSAGYASSVDAQSWNVSDFDPMEISSLGIANQLPAALMAEGEGTMMVAGAPWLMQASTATGAMGIVEQPQGHIIYAGEPVTLRVAAAGAGVSYQWFEGASGDGRAPIPGANDATYTTPALTQSRDYWVRVTSSFGQQASVTAHVEVLTPPVITVQPADATAVAGGNAVFTVAATGIAPLRYEWSFNGVAIAGATASSLSITGIQFNHVGDYSAVVFNAYGAITSRTATLRGANPPSIQTQPQPTTLSAGASGTLSVTATSASPLTYQWRRNGVGIPGATNSAYVLSAASGPAAGRYDVVVSDGFAYTVSQPVDVQVSPTSYAQVGRPDAAFKAKLEQAGGYPAGFLRLSDGRIVAFGSFSRFNGSTATNLVRLLTDGSVDMAFSAPRLDGAVYAAAAQPDGKLIVGGAFREIDGHPRAGLARLQPDGSLDPSFVPAGDFVGTFAVAVQVDGRVLAGGSFSARVARLSATGARDVSFTPLPDGSVFAIATAGDGAVVLGGAFTKIGGQARGRLARFNPDGSLDNAFAATTGCNDDVYAVRLLPDGRLVAAGAFTAFAGATANRIIRLTSAGEPDGTWSSGSGFNAPVYSLELQPDGAVLAGGVFSSYRGTQRLALARLAQNGAHDAGFVPPVLSHALTAVSHFNDGTVLIGGGFSTVAGNVRWAVARLSATGNSLVSSFGPGMLSPGSASRVLPLASGKLVVVGEFSHVGGVLRPSIARLNADGQLDTTFNGGAGPNAPIADAVVLADDKIVIGGSFTSYNGAPLNAGCIARLNADGSLDTQFTNKTNWSSFGQIEWLVPSSTGRIYVFSPHVSGYLRRRNADGTADGSFDPGNSSSAIRVAIEQPDGRVIVGGAFISFNGRGNRLVRLLPTGALDLSFTAEVDGTVTAVALQSDGRIVIGGDFTLVNGVPRTRLAQLNADGSLDASFNSGFGPNAGVRRLLVQQDGRVVALGDFTSINNSPHTEYIARLLPGGAVDSTFAVPGLRAPPNDLALLDDGSLLLAGDSLPAGIEGGIGLTRLTTTAGPILEREPAGVDLTAGVGHSLSVLVAGGTGVAYQWIKDGAAIPGATAASLSRPSWQSSNAGSYIVRVSHSAGTLDSAVANVTVAASPPVAASNSIAGFGSVIRAGSRWPLTAPSLFSGSEPLSYQWSKDGIALPGATAAQFLPPTWQPSDSGVYRVAITNSGGTITTDPFQQLVTPALDWQWTAPNPQGNSMVEADYLNNRFLLGGVHGTILTSSDGFGWSVVRLGSSNSVFAFAYGNTRYVALSGFSGIWSSADASVWQQHDSRIGGDGRQLRALAFGAGRFVAVGDGGVVASSTDGRMWSPAEAGTTASLTAIAFGGGIFVALGSDARTYRSTDGVAWAVAATLPRPLTHLVHGQSRFVAAGGTSVFVSPDGIAWTERIPNSAHPIRSLKAADTGFVAALGTTAGRYLVSGDGNLWIEKPVGTLAVAPNGLAFGGGRYIMVGPAPETLLTSDGISWMRTAANATMNFTGAAASDAAMIAVSSSGFVRMTSSGFDAPVFGIARDVAFGAGRFVAVGGSGGGTISISTDGVAWDPRALGAVSDLYGVNFVGDRFIAVGQNGTLLTSTDGASWVPQVAGTNQALLKSASGAGIYVVVGAAGTIVTSSNGQNWTVRSANGVTSEITDVVFAAGKFILVSGDGSIRTSSDGVTWSPRVNPLSVGLKSLVHAGGKLYAFSTGNTSYLTSPDGITWTAAQHGNANTTGDAIVFKDRIYIAGANGSIVSLPLDVTAPAIATPPVVQEGVAGADAAFTVVATGTAPLHYQWFRNSTAIFGATEATLSLVGLSASHAGSYSVRVTNAGGSVTSASVPLVVNTSTPGLVASKAEAAGGDLRGAFTIEGMVPKQMLIRAVGPTLANFGVTAFLADPTISIVNAATGVEVAGNNDWELSSNASQIAAVAAQVGAYPLSAGSKDAAVLAAFAPGSYRVTIGPAGATGVASLEIYDADSTPRLVYVASRAHVDAAGALVHGVTLEAPPAGRSYLIRALGPSTGLPTALADPQLAVFSGTTQLAANDNWGGDAILFELAHIVGAMPIATTSKDAALKFIPPAAGVYTVEVTGAGGTTGTALVEIFEVDALRAATVPLAFVSMPLDLTVDAGEPVSFGIVTVGRPTATFQWSRNDSPIAGAGGSMFLLASAQVADAGTYSVRAENGGISPLTATAVLTVNPANNARHSLLGRGYEPGGTVTVFSSLHHVGSPTSVGWTVDLPTGWSFASDSATTAAIKPAINATGTLTWTWNTPPPSPVTFTYTLNVPAGEAGTRNLVASAMIGGAGPIVAAPNPLPVPLAPVLHSADTSGDNRIDLIELTRVIELYNTRNGTLRTGAYGLATTETEDGFVAVPARPGGEVETLARHHSADTSPRDGRINLLELTRVIELYNYRSGTTRTGQYRVLEGTEDGFAPGP